MKKIGEYVELIDDELKGAKCYAEKYVDFKSQGKIEWANKFKQMAVNELDHSNTVHELAVYEIQELNKIYKPPVEMEEEWNRMHKKYVEKTAWIKQMLSM